MSAYQYGTELALELQKLHISGLLLVIVGSPISKYPRDRGRERERDRERGLRNETVYCSQHGIVGRVPWCKDYMEPLPSDLLYTADDMSISGS